MTDKPPFSWDGFVPWCRSTSGSCSLRTMTGNDAAAPGERKRQLLGLLYDRGELSTSDLLSECDICRTTVCRHMNRYRRHGDVEVEDGGFIPGLGRQENTYCLTDRGEQKVEYYRSQES